MARTGGQGSLRLPRASLGRDGMQALPNILIVDGDAALRRSLSEQLERDGEFACFGCGDAAAALHLLGRRSIDAVLIDAGLADMDGRALCREMRRRGVAASIVMLAAADTAGETANAHDAGADDCLTKPLRLNQLLARLRFHL